MGPEGIVDVCVTGGTGYIASCIIRGLLQRGYNVRTTARNPAHIASCTGKGALHMSPNGSRYFLNEESAEEDQLRVGDDDKTKTAFLWELPGARERLQVVKAELLEEGSFDSAVWGVHTVFHTACPVLYDPSGDPQVTMLNPALQGNMNLLKACAKSPSVKRVVMTSSCSAIRYDYNRTEKDPPLDESVWSNVEYCKEHKLWYPLAKTLAEKEATEFAAKAGFNLVVLTPSFVIGPMLAPVPTSTISLILGLVTGAEEYPNIRIGFVHIDDVVEAHLLAMEVPEMQGRYICSSDVAHFVDIVDMLRCKYPNLQLPRRCSDRKGDDIYHKMDTTKIHNLGFTKFKTLEEMFDDCLHSFHQNGLLGNLYEIFPPRIVMSELQALQGA